MNHTHRLTLGLALLAFGACGGSGGDTGMATPAPAQSAAPAAQPAAAQPMAQPEMAGAFTMAQATRGRQVFRSICSECHYTNEFSSDDFKYSWRRDTAAGLYDYMADAMPEDAPGSLTSQQYLDVLAYILDMNDFPTGSTELSRDALAGISLARLSGF